MLRNVCNKILKWQYKKWVCFFERCCEKKKKMDNTITLLLTSMFTDMILICQTGIFLAYSSHSNEDQQRHNLLFVALKESYFLMCNIYKLILLYFYLLKKNITWNLLVE